MRSEIDGPGIGLPALYKYRAWFFILIAILVGSALSIGLCDWTWLSRSGAIIVVITLITASFNTRTASKEIIDLCESTLGQIADDNQKISMQTALQNEFIEDLKRLELQMGIAGTLLWGFADLINLAVKNC